jgi:macrolide transport system ATP-binding/permease protein
MLTLTQQVAAIHHLTKFYGDHTILNGITFSLNRHDRMGLVGENGAGKSTLARLLLGELTPDEGEIIFAPGCRIGYLPQEADMSDSIPITDFLTQRLGRLTDLANTLHALEQSLSEATGTALADLLNRYGETQEAYTRMGGYDLDQRIEAVFIGLEIAHLDRQRPMKSLSGGEKTRVLLAALLLSTPDLLILDEPTNHLDFKAVDWLENYLLAYTGAMLIISHDRRFLNTLVTQIAELTPHDHQLRVYHGNYDAFIAERERQRATQQALYESQQSELKDLRRQIKMKTHNAPAPPPPPDGDKMLYDAKGQRFQQTTARKLRALRQRLHTLEDQAVDRPTRRWQINPDFNPETLGSREVIRLDGIEKRFGDRVVLTDVNAIITGGARVVLIGENGAGKTTLLRIILGLLQPDRGTVRIAGGAQIGYLDQEQETLPAKHTVLAEFQRGLALSETDARSALHKYGLFKEEQALQPIHTLSIGQRRKLQIARLIATRANLLILDEPTNHLDLESVEQFEQALIAFPGTILATSHDRYFVERVASEVWSVAGGRVVIDS